MSRTNFHGPRGVRAIEVLLYMGRKRYSLVVFFVQMAFKQPLLVADLTRALMGSVLGTLREITLSFQFASHLKGSQLLRKRLFSLRANSFL